MQSGRADAGPASRRSASAAGRRGRTRTKPQEQRQAGRTRLSATPARECGRHRFPSVRGSRTWDAGRCRRPARQGAAVPRARRRPERPRNPAGRSTHAADAQLRPRDRSPATVGRQAGKSQHVRVRRPVQRHRVAVVRETDARDAFEPRERRRRNSARVLGREQGEEGQQQAGGERHRSGHQRWGQLSASSARPAPASWNSSPTEAAGYCVAHTRT